MMDDLLNPITGLTSKERKSVLSWVASLPEERIIEIFQDAVKKSFQLKDEQPKLPGKTVKYCAFILAGRKNGWDTVRGKGYRVAGDEQFEDFTSLRSAKTAELIKRGRSPVKRKQILAYWGEVKELRANGVGFRGISQYLAKERKVKASASYLQMLWSEVEKHG